MSSVEKIGVISQIEITYDPNKVQCTLWSVWSIGG